MHRGRPFAPLHVSDQVREQLKLMANSRALPHALVSRVQIVLLSADGLSNKSIAQKIGLSGSMVGMWCKRFIQQGLIMGSTTSPGPEGPGLEVMSNHGAMLEFYFAHIRHLMAILGRSLRDHCFLPDDYAMRDDSVPLPLSA